MTYIDPEGKLLWHLDKVEALRTGERLPPVNVEIDLSNRCSLGCSWCHFAYTHTRGPAKGQQDKPEGAIPGGDLLELELAHMILAQLSMFGVKSISWTGGGEPTLHPDFEEIILSCHSWGRDKQLNIGFPIDQGIYTHGGHIGEKRAIIMKKAMTWVYVSLDATDARQYALDKGVPAKRFAAALQGISNLVKADGDAVIGVGFMIHSGNYDKAHEMIKLAHDLGADYCQFRPAVIFDSQEPGKAAENTEWALKAMNYLKKFSGSDFVQVDLKRFDEYFNWWQHGYETCWWSGMQTVITPNGKVWTCVNKREYPGHELGDLNEDSFEDIWNRHGLATVDSSCRLLCRGHAANKALDELMKVPAHVNFI